jgi:hypothetical protein
MTTSFLLAKIYVHRLVSTQAILSGFGLGIVESKFCQPDALLPANPDKPHLFTVRNTREDISDLPGQLRTAEIVVHDIIGQGTLAVKRNLKFFPCPKLLFVPDTQVFGPLGPYVQPAIHKNKPVTPFVPPHLCQKGHIQHNGLDPLLLIVTLYQPFSKGQNKGVGYTIQTRKPAGIGENQIGQFRAADFSGRTQHGPSETTYYFIPNSFFVKYLVGDFVRVNHLAAQLGKFSGDRAFARANTTQDSNYRLLWGIFHAGKSNARRPGGQHEDSEHAAGRQAPFCGTSAKAGQIRQI